MNIIGKFLEFGLLIFLSACTRGELQWQILNQGSGSPTTSSTTVGLNLVSNPGFEEGMTSWNSTGSSGSSLIVTSPVYAGHRALEVGTGALVSQDIASQLVAGVTYTLTVETELVSSSDQNAEVGIQFLDSQGTLISQLYLNPLSPAWSQSVIAFVYPADAASAEVFVSKSAGNSYMYVDNFSVVAQGNFTSNLENFGSGLCLQGGGTSGSSMTQEACSPVASQSLLFEPQDNGTLVIQVSPELNLCLDAPGTQVAGESIVANPCDGSSTQQWQYQELPGSDVQHGSFLIETQSGDYCITEGSSTGGTTAVLSACLASPVSSTQAFIIANWGDAGASVVAAHASSSPQPFSGMIRAEVSAMCVISTSNASGPSSSSGAGMAQYACGSAYWPLTFNLSTSANEYEIQTTAGLCLDFGVSSTSGLQVVQNTCAGTSSQLWSLSQSPDGLYSLVTSDGKGCLGISGGSQSSGASVVTTACDSSTAQNFWITLPNLTITSSYSGATFLPLVSGLYVNVNNSLTTPGTGIEQYLDLAGSLSELFNLAPFGNGFYWIEPQSNSALCLDAGASTTAGLQVVQNTCNVGLASQEWLMEENPDGTYSIGASDGQGCWEVQYTSSMTKAIIQTEPCDGSIAQRFGMGGI